MKLLIPNRTSKMPYPFSKKVKRCVYSAHGYLGLLLFLIGCAWTDAALGVPDYSDENSVATYVKQILYWEDADVANKEIAAFRYKTLLYSDNDGAVRPDHSQLATIYTETERARSEQAEQEIRMGLAENPSSTLLAGLLLDIHYDRAVPDLIEAGNLITTAERLRLGPPSVPSGLVIDDEIGLSYQKALDAYRNALADYFALLNDDLGLTNAPPAGYQFFQQLVPSRGLAPAMFLDDGVPTSVSGDTTPLFAGYKDLVLLYNGLRDYGRTAVALARLQYTRNNAGDRDATIALITESQRFIYLHASTLLGMFPGLDPNADPDSGLAEATAGVGDSLTALDRLRQTLAGRGNILGFEDDFLMLVQKFPGQSGDVFDSFDAFQLRLNPFDLSSPLRYAKDLLESARNSYDDYRGFQDQLATQTYNVNESARDRLYQIVGAYPGTDAYEAAGSDRIGDSIEGSEIWLQFNSIKSARYAVRRNDVESSNLEHSITNEINRSNEVSKAVIRAGNKIADLTEVNAGISAGQAAANEVAAAMDTEFISGIWAHSVNAAVQASGEAIKGANEAAKERLAAMQDAEVEGINSAYEVKTMMLERNTLLVDSLEAALQVEQEIGRLNGIISERNDLEGLMAENKQELSTRYFADPVHRLRYQHQTMLANLSFDEAQKWLYFMSRVLEYKWNTPFMNYFYLGRRWSSDTLFKLRNAEELEQFYNAMVSFNSLVQLPRDDYFDWFSVREDFFGYKQTDDSGQVAYYADPQNPEGPADLTAIQAFRRRLEGMTNSLGNIELRISTVREIPGGTFFRGARFDENGNPLSAGLFLDKIKWMKINLPGNHTLGRSQLAGELSYGGTGFIRNFDVGTYAPDRPDRLQNELTTYSTRYWYFHPPSASWRFSSTLKSPVTMQLDNDSRVPPSVREIDIFKERSVATTGWELTIPTQDLGVQVLNINELDDVELYFYHYAVSRQLPEGGPTAASEDVIKASAVAPPTRPFPYNLPYE